MNHRYPDKPTRSSKVALSLMEMQDTIALVKLDGWCCRICWDREAPNNGLEFLSSSGGTLPVGPVIKAAVADLVESDKLPVQGMIVGEWMKRRPEYDGPEQVQLFSPMELNREWVGHLAFKQRWEWMNSLGLPVDDLNIVQSDQMPDHPLILPESTDFDLSGLFNKTVDVWRTEGIVVYKAEGIISGSRDGSAKTKDMLKVKWRDGHDGRTHV